MVLTFIVPPRSMAPLPAAANVAISVLENPLVAPGNGDAARRGPAARAPGSSAAHRALMFLATYSLAVVGLGRFLGMLAPYVHMSVLLAIFFGPIVVAAVYDWRKRGRLQPLYIVGFVVYLLFRSPVQAIWNPFLREHWPPVGRALLQPFL